MADAWAVEGARLAGERGARFTERAARLRARLWRLERRKPDALEAIELYHALARQQADEGCEARLEGALLEAEFGGDPVQGYKNLYLVHSAAKEDACRRRAGIALDSLSAYKPLPSVLAELDRKTEGTDPKASPNKLGGAANHVVLPRGTATSNKPARITRIERYGAEDSARVVVFVSHPTLFKVGTVPASGGKGPRVFVDVEHASYKGKMSFDASGVLKRVRLGKQGAATRVVLDLEVPVFHRVFYLPEPFRLIVDVSKTPYKATLPRPRGKRTVKRVVLDPGHGGHDPGATGPTGLREKDVTLDIAHRAAPLVARELSISTLLTRDTDDYVALDERTARANAFKADLFISIHANASENPISSGVMTFVLDESGDAVASQIAARENAASAAAAAELANAMSRVLDAGSLSESVHFAELLQRSTMASVGTRYGRVRDQGVKRAGFYVLAGAQMPAVLYEMSFISNPSGEVRLNTADYRQKMADAIVNAIRAYRDGL